jgi:hypothetical protein
MQTIRRGSVSSVGVEAMARDGACRNRLEKLPRFVSFDAGVVVALLGVGIYLAVMNRRWIAAALLLCGALWMMSIPLRLRGRKAKTRS